MLRRLYRLKYPLVATAVDDSGQPRFHDDTQLPAGTEVRIVEGRHPWPARPGTDRYYTVEVRDSRYVVEAGALDAAI